MWRLLNRGRENRPADRHTTRRSVPASEVQRPEGALRACDSIDNAIAGLNELETIARRHGCIDDAEQIRDRVRDAKLPLLVLVTGEGNFGKSSLINALAGKPIAPVSRLPLTWKVDIYQDAGADGPHALVRHSGQQHGTRMSVPAAEDLCAREELRLKEHSRRSAGTMPPADIVEVIWRVPDLAFGRHICLVDTPGLSAMGLGVQVKTERLLSGLGAVFSVSDIWEYYYHRADAVLWVMAANALESASTHETLRAVAAQFTKSVTPVITKCDPWIESGNEAAITDKFASVFREFIGGGMIHALPFLTVCGGKSPTVGFGVRDLTEYLAKRVAPQALEAKTRASAVFVADASNRLRHRLNAAALQLMDNLRVIADTADQVALDLARQVRHGVVETREAFLRHQQHLSYTLASDLRAAMTAVVWGRTDTYVLGQQLGRSANLERMARNVRDQITAIGGDLHSATAALCRSRPLARVRIQSTGQETRDTFAFTLELP